MILKRRFHVCCFITLLFQLLTLPGNSQNRSIPHLEKQANPIKLIVRDKPILLLAGELHNSSTSGAAFMRPIWKLMAKKNLNTVIAPVYWELMEPEEGRFDFTLVDSMILGARKENLHLVILWFGSWKNGYSMYVPGWVKKDQERFPRAISKDGNQYQMLSTFGEESMKADARAFKALMRHIKEIDADYQTVITIQIENEIGLFSTPRDYCDAATRAFKNNLPANLTKYLASNKGKLQPEIDSAWSANGSRTTGTWEQVFGKSMPYDKNWKSLSYLSEELFTVYQYARYIEAIAAAGKEEYPIPMYVNAWLKQARMPYPGTYPSGGPIPHTLDIWRAAAPSIDFIAPDIYVSLEEAMYVADQYSRSGNPLFIPEFRHDDRAALFAFWLYGTKDAMCFAPFGIDDVDAESDAITKTYAALKQVQDLVLEHQGRGSMAGIYLDSTRKSQEFQLGGYSIRAQVATPIQTGIEGYSVRVDKVSSAAGLVINIAPDEFIVVGKDYRLSFAPLKPDPENPNIDMEYLDEGTFVDGRWVTTRRLNGDEGSVGGDYGFGFAANKAGYIRFQRQPGDQFSILRYKMYRY